MFGRKRRDPDPPPRGREHPLARTAVEYASIHHVVPIRPLADDWILDDLPELSVMVRYCYPTRRAEVS